MGKKDKIKPIVVETNPPQRNKWLAVALIALAAFIVYFNSLHAPFIFDDILKIKTNPDIRSLSNITSKLIYQYKNASKGGDPRNDPSRPVTYLTFALNYHFGGLNTFGYHLFNVFLHILNSILIFFLARKIILLTYKKDYILFPLLAGLFFAVHPINTEAVTYIYHRSESLALFFYLASLLFFIETLQGRKYWLVLSVVSFILGIFSKQTAATLPAIALLFDYIFLSNYDTKKLYENKYFHASLWIALACYILFRVSYFGQVGDAETDAYLKWDRFSYFITQPYVILKYIRLLLVPSGLCIDHIIHPLKLSEPKALLSFLAIAVIFVFVYMAYRKKSDDSKIILFGSLWFFIALSPTSSFLPILDAMAERRLYIPGVGFCLLAAFFYFRVFYRNDYLKKAGLWLFICFSVIHLSALGMAAIVRNRLYLDPVKQWESVISMYPESRRANNNLAAIYAEKKDYPKATQYYMKSLEIEPDNAKTYFDFGNMHFAQGDFTKAMEEYQKAISINPNVAEGHYNLAVIYHNLKDYTRAIQEYQSALDLEPAFVEAHNNLGQIYSSLKEYDKAIMEYQGALILNPSFIYAKNNLSALLEKLHAALKSDPNNKVLKKEIENVEALLK